jgi:hypothetical protein
MAKSRLSSLIFICLPSSFQVTLDNLSACERTILSSFHERLAESNKTIDSPPPSPVELHTDLRAKGAKSQFVHLIHISSCLIWFCQYYIQTHTNCYAYVSNTKTIAGHVRHFGCIELTRKKKKVSFSFRKIRWWPGRFRPTCSPSLKTFLSFLLFVLCQYLTMG